MQFFILIAATKTRLHILDIKNGITASSQTVSGIHPGCSMDRMYSRRIGAGREDEELKIGGLFMFGKKKKTEKPVILVESWSPSCKIQAFVEESDTSCYFYLWVHPGAENAIKSCWICNVGKTPEKLETDIMKNGMAPAMPAEYVKHNPEGIRLKKEEFVHRLV